MIKIYTLRRVDEQNLLDSKWIPKDLIWDPVASVWLVESVYVAFYEMNHALQKEGIPSLGIALGYRSYAMQKKIYLHDLFLQERALTPIVEAYHLWCDRQKPPGASEHQLGTSLDIVPQHLLKMYAPIEGMCKVEVEQAWLGDYAVDYGFIQTDKEKPWHYRYVGRGHAKKIKRLALTPDDYFQSIGDKQSL